MSEISELMARDPLQLTKEDRTAIIVYFRENRVRFIQGNKSAGSAKAKPEPKVKEAKPKLDLGELDI